jgi:hypothetical protein
MSDELIKRPFDEEFDTMMEVQRNPTGAWMVIQEQAVHIEQLEREQSRLHTQCDGLMQAAMNNGQALILAEAKLAKAMEALRSYTKTSVGFLAKEVLAELDRR